MAGTVTVVVTTYYRNEMLERAIESVLDVKYPSVELIVVDGSGEGHARPVVESYDVDCYIPQPTDCGPHAARSVGASVASGQYVQFLDDDDTLSPETFRARVPLLESNDDVGVVYSGVELYDGEIEYPDPDVRGDVLEPALRWSTGPCMPSTMLIDRAVLDELLPFSNLHAADDLGFTIELARRTEFEFVEDPLTHHDDRPSLGYSVENARARKRVLERYAPLYEQYPAAKRAALATYWRILGIRLLREEEWSPGAILAFARALYYTENMTLKDFGNLLTAFGGWETRRVVQRAFERF
jgi:glycosyltransferase involved in cell wall biosynthesis